MTSATVILFQGWTRSDPVVKVTEYEGLTVRDMRHEIARHLHKNGKYLDVPEDTLASRIVISGHGAKNEKGERLDIMSVMDTPVLWEHVGLAKYRVNDKPSSGRVEETEALANGQPAFQAVSQVHQQVKVKGEYPVPRKNPRGQAVPARGPAPTQVLRPALSDDGRTPVFESGTLVLPARRCAHKIQAPGVECTWVVGESRVLKQTRRRLLIRAA